MSDIIARGMATKAINAFAAGSATRQRKFFNFVDSGAPILVPDATTNNEAFLPCVVSMYKYLSNPINKYYMYWTPHDPPSGGGGLYLHTAPTPLGPWTPYPSLDTALFAITAFDAVINDGSTAYKFQCPEFKCINGSFYMSYTRWNGSTLYDVRYLTSTDGINWTYGGMLLSCPNNNCWDANERVGFHSIYSQGRWQAVYQGRNHCRAGSANLRTGIGYAESEDFKNWNKLAQPLWRGNAVPAAVVSESGTFPFNVGGDSEVGIVDLEGTI